MVGQNDENSKEELSFGKIGKNNSEQRYSHVYALFHLKTVPWIGSDLVGIDYKTLVSYLRGAYFAKFPEDFSLFNGISETTKDKSYTNVEFLPFKANKLQKLIRDAEISDRFKIRTID
jgi:hypothetical protein